MDFNRSGWLWSELIRTKWRWWWCYLSLDNTPFVLYDEEALLGSVEEISIQMIATYDDDDVENPIKWYIMKLLIGKLFIIFDKIFLTINHPIKR